MNVNLAEKMKLTNVFDSDTEDAVEAINTHELLRRDASPEKQRLEELRQVSNIIQALENLVVQCEGAAGFEELQVVAKGALEAAGKQLRSQLHFM